MQQIRPITIHSDHALVPLTRGYYAVVDLQDVALVAKYNWYAEVKKNAVYAVRCVWRDGKQSTQYMHRLLGAEAGYPHTDHGDGDGLNNRRSNLRPATVSQNICNSRMRSNNTTGVKGVSYNKKINKYVVTICHNGTRHHFGVHLTLEDAAAVANFHRDRLHGVFAKRA